MPRTVILFGIKPGLIEAVTRRGLTPLVIEEDPQSGVEHSIEVPTPLSSRSVELDWSDRIKAYLDENHLDPVAVVPVYEYYVELAAVFRDRFFPNLVGFCVETARLFRDKLEMKRAMQRAGIPVPTFRDFCGDESYSEIVSHLGVPFLLKPRKEALARGIRRIATEAQWVEAIESLDVDSYYVEELLVDPLEYSCDTLVAADKVVFSLPASYSTTCLNSSVDKAGFGSCFPADVSTEFGDRLRSLAIRVVQRFKISDAFCHIELLFSKGELYFSEMGLRLTGGRHLDAESVCLGADVRDLYLDVFLSTDLPTGPLPIQQRCAYYLYPPVNGRVLGIENTIHDQIGVIDTEVFVEPGEQYKRKDESTDTSGFVLFCLEDHEEFREALLEAHSWLSLKLTAEED